MGRELDRRATETTQINPERIKELNSRASIAGLARETRIEIIDLDPLTGNPARVVSKGPPTADGNFVQRALQHVQNIGQVLGLAPAQAPEFFPDPQPQQTSSGATAVHLQQQYKGIPIFRAAGTVHFGVDGALLETVGSMVTVPRDIPVSATVSVEDAVAIAAKHVAAPDEDQGTDQFGRPLKNVEVDLTDFKPKVIASFPNRPDQPTVLEPGPFGAEIKASLVWFPSGADFKLCWETIITMPGQAGQYRTIVDSSTGEVMYCRQLIQAVIGTGNVYLLNGSQRREMVDFPQPLSVYGLPIPSNLPPNFPDHWVDSNETAGNAARGSRGDNGISISGTLENGKVVFNPPDHVGNDQRVLNIFYYTCFMHDLVYLLGFREADGNFQLNNLGRGGLPGDRVDAKAFPGEVWSTANFITPVDGSSPTMNMGHFTPTDRHTAFDATIVFHEFMHGVTNRLVGGASNSRSLEAPQSGGMGEGWSDYVACTITGLNVVASWLVDNPAGIRKFRYDQFPFQTDNFGSLGKGRYVNGEVHNIGEIWCATLLQMNRNIGAELGIQLVFDGLKVTPANPSFLDARNAIIFALDQMLAAGRINQDAHRTALDGIWAAFAQFGMGPNASCVGAYLTGIFPDFNRPAPQPPATPTPLPVIRGIQVSGVLETGATITWSTDVPTVGQVEFGKTSQHGQATPAETSSATNHIAVLTGLTANTTYHFRVTVADSQGSKVSSNDLTFSTAKKPEAPSGAPIHVTAPPGGGVTELVSVIEITSPGVLRNVKITIDLDQTPIKDLFIEIISPANKRFILRQTPRDDATALTKSYSNATHPILNPLIGQPVQGKWFLHVLNVKSQVVGNLVSWGLDLELAGSVSTGGDTHSFDFGFTLPNEGLGLTSSPSPYLDFIS